MSNPYYTKASTFTPGQTARGENVDDEYDLIEDGFDLIYSAIQTLEAAVVALGGSTDPNAMNTRFHVALSGGTTAYTGTASPAPSSYANGMFYIVEPNVNNTSGVTLNFNSLGAKPLTDVDGNALTAGQFKQGGRYLVSYKAATDSWLLITSLSSAAVSVPAFAAHKNGASQSITSATLTKLTFGTENYDITSAYDAASSKFTAATAGRYLFHCTIAFTDNNSDECHLALYKNGTQYRVTSTRVTLIDESCSITAEVDLAAGDYVEVYCVRDAYTGVVYGASSDSWFSGHYIG